MTLSSALVVSAALLGVGLYGVLSQQSFVMIMMGLELMLNGVLLAVGALWAFAGAGAPKGQLLALIVLLVMAVEMVVGFTVVVVVYRVRQADTTESIATLRG